MPSNLTSKRKIRSRHMVKSELFNIFIRVTSSRKDPLRSKLGISRPLGQFPYPRCAKVSSPNSAFHFPSLRSDGDLNLNTGLDVDDDLLDNLSGGVEAARIVNDYSPYLNPTPGKEHNTYSIKRLWMRISNRSQVLEPSPLGVLRVEIFRFLVGRRTGPLTASDLLLARSMSSLHTFSSDLTSLLVRVMRILWILGPSPKSLPPLSPKEAILKLFVVEGCGCGNLRAVSVCGGEGGDGWGWRTFNLTRSRLEELAGAIRQSDDWWRTRKISECSRSRMLGGGSKVWVPSSETSGLARKISQNTSLTYIVHTDLYRIRKSVGGPGDSHTPKFHHEQASTVRHRYESMTLGHD